MRLILTLFIRPVKPGRTLASRAEALPLVYRLEHIAALFAVALVNYRLFRRLKFLSLALTNVDVTLSLKSSLVSDSFRRVGILWYSSIRHNRVTSRLDSVSEGYSGVCQRCQRCRVVITDQEHACGLLQ